ncbi:C45 family autoproteolytic acyltransferase/hydolase [Acrocarpospora pleiomorpha]
MHAERIAETVARYAQVFRALAGRPVRLEDHGSTALARIDGWAPALGSEIRGIAEGSGVPAELIAAVNARTEILAAESAPVRGECSTVVALGRDQETEPLAAQNWDWFGALADCWLVWTIPHPDGRVTCTLTEYGIVGKIGCNDRGVGVLFNILHHQRDGGPIGVPVHVVARQALDTATNVAEALLTLGTASLSASTTMTVVGGVAAGKTAVSAELYPDGIGHVLPSTDGLLIHTNHFLSEPARFGDTEPRSAPDTIVRYEVLRRALNSRVDSLDEKEIGAALSSHVGGTGAVCCHPDPARPADLQYATLATAWLDLAAGRVHATVGGPCAAASTA